jgi:hypothetical protein
LKIFVGVLAVYLVVTVVLGMFWSSAPDTFDVREQAREMTNSEGGDLTTGVATVATVVTVMDTLLEKSGGFIVNDIFPPGLWLDNMPHWEVGALVTIRDMSRALRRDISRSQSQSAEDTDLAIAEPQMSFDYSSWMFPSSESEYRRGIGALRRYLQRLAGSAEPSAQFYARADNLNSWLADVETRLGSLSRGLSESVGKQSVGDGLTDLPPKTGEGSESYQAIKTPFFEIDDVFYKARGTAWALLHLFRAIEIDFRDVLIDKNAMVSVQQVIIELEGSQQALWSPIILNGDGFGILANHSLTMASYMARANSAISDLRNLLDEG